MEATRRITEEWEKNANVCSISDSARYSRDPSCYLPTNWKPIPTGVGVIRNKEYTFHKTHKECKPIIKYNIIQLIF
jgi:hypothetical protein